MNKESLALIVAMTAFAFQSVPQTYANLTPYFLSPGRPVHPVFAQMPTIALKEDELRLPVYRKRNALPSGQKYEIGEEYSLK